jgi:hypothetical protein
MTVKVTRDAINLREKLSELDKPAGIAGTEILRADTPQEVFNYINAGRRNLIINGDMRIDQRNAGASHTGSGFVYSTDRWWTYYASGFSGTITRQQSTDAPDGFTHSLKWTVGTADTSITSTEQYIINQSIEAQNMSQLGLGTSWAKNFTLSFWVKSSVTGQYGVMVGSSSNTLYTTTVTVNAADTWEYKTVTIPGTSTGSWGTGNNIGLYVRITLAAGTDYQTNFGTWSVGTYKLTNSSQVNWMKTSGNTFYLTGVQLEVGSVATPFEHRSYGEELALCQRYFIKHINTSFYNAGVSSHTLRVALPVEMRANPTITRVGSFWSGSEAAPTIGIYEKKAFMISGSTATYLGGNFTADAEL